VDSSFKNKFCNVFTLQLLLLELIRSDLVHTTINNEVNPVFTDFYKNLLYINNLLGHQENSMKYLELYLKSQQLKNKYLNMPVKLKQNLLKREVLYY